MTILKVGDEVQVKHEAYNVQPSRAGMRGKVTRIDESSEKLQVRVEYDAFSFNWTNHESLELIKAAPSKHAEVGKEILDRMQGLKAAIATRDDAIKTVDELTVALDKLLAENGLKRADGPEAPKVESTPVTRTAAQDWDDGVIEEGTKYRLTKPHSYFTVGNTYTVEELDDDDTYAPVCFMDDADDGNWPSVDDLSKFVRTV